MHVYICTCQHKVYVSSVYPVPGKAPVYTALQLLTGV